MLSITSNLKKVLENFQQCINDWIDINIVMLILCSVIWSLCQIIFYNKVCLINKFKLHWLNP